VAFGPSLPLSAHGSLEFGGSARMRPFADGPLFVACGTEPAACTMATMIVANASGQFQVGDPQATHTRQRSYRIRLP
jgi:hypothetical protein